MDPSKHSCSVFRQESLRVRLLQLTRTWTMAILLSPFPEGQVFGKAFKLHTDATWKLFKEFPKEILWYELSDWLIDLSRTVSTEYLWITKILLFPVQIRERTTLQHVLLFSAYCHNPWEVASVTCSPVQVINHLQPRNSERLLSMFYISSSLRWRHLSVT